MIDAKRYLQQIRRYDLLISMQCAELRQLEEMVLRITPTLKDSVVSAGSTSQDKLAAASAKIVDLEVEICREVERFLESRRRVVATIDRLSNLNQIQVLHKRYVLHKTLDRIAYDMNMSYRNVCYIHGKALQEIDKILKGETNEIGI